MDKNKIKNIVKIITKIIITVLILCISLYGALYSLILCSAFDINIISTYWSTLLLPTLLLPLIYSKNKKKNNEFRYNRRYWI